MNRSSVVGWIALVALAGGCGVLGDPKLDFSDPEVLVYTTRLGLAQTYDTVATGVEQGVVTKSQGASLKTQLDRGTAVLELAETAVATGKTSEARSHIEQALQILSAVRKDPALASLIARNG